MEPITVRIISRDLHSVQCPFRSINELFLQYEPGPNHTDRHAGCCCSTSNKSARGQWSQCSRCRSSNGRSCNGGKTSCRDHNDARDGRNENTEDGLGVGGFVVAVIRVAGDCESDSAGLSSYAITGLNNAPVERTEHRKDVDEGVLRLDWQSVLIRFLPLTVSFP